MDWSKSLYSSSAFDVQLYRYGVFLCVENTAVHAFLRKAQLVREHGKIVPPPPQELGLGSPLPATVYVDMENQYKKLSFSSMIYCMFCK